MGRVKENIDVKGHKFWTLFDTGPRNTYVVPKVAKLLVTSALTKPFKTAQGGSIKRANKTALLEGTIEGCRVSTHAMVVDEIGRDEEGNEIDILFGALAMQQWGIHPIPNKEKLDTSHYSREFVEF